MRCVLIPVLDEETKMIRTYKELIRLPTFEERFRYLKLSGRVGEATFGYDRYINQLLYNSPEWKRLRDKIIVRDGACDLGVVGYELYGDVTIHHMNPITLEDIEQQSNKVWNPEFLICTSGSTTHKAIHYGNEQLLMKKPVIRRPNDVCPWK